VFKAHAERLHGTKIKTVRCDGAGENTSQAFIDHLHDVGIQYELTCPRTPEQNPVAERKNRSLLTLAISMLSHARLSKSYWSFALQHANFILNSTESAAFERDGDIVVPYVEWHHREPDLVKLRTFGCPAYMHVDKSLRKKLDPKAMKLIYVGRDDERAGGYLLVCPVTMRRYRSRDVVFDESFASGHGQGRVVRSSTGEILTMKPLEQSGAVEASSVHGSVGATTVLDPDDPATADIPNAGISNVVVGGMWAPYDANDDDITEDVVDPDTNVDFPMFADTGTNDNGVDGIATLGPADSPSSTGVSVDQSVRRSSRNRTKTVKWSPDKDQAHSIKLITTVDDSDIVDTVAGAMIDDATRMEMTLLASSVSDATSDVNAEPATLRAIKCLPADVQEKWKDAIRSEWNSLMKRGTWKLVKLPHGRTAIKSGWVFKLKRDRDGNVCRYKARLVAKGYSQRAGIDYQETFAPVIRMSTFRVVVGIANAMGFLLDQCDVETAFLLPTTTEEIYMQRAPLLDGLVLDGYGDDDYRIVCRLLKTLYGLKQSAHEFNKLITKVLVSIGFRQSKVDSCVFVLYNKDGRFDAIIGCWVDDTVIGARNADIMRSIKVDMRKNFDITDGGPLSFFVGIKIERDLANRVVHLSQRALAEELLKRFDMTACSSKDTPCDPSVKLSKDQTPTTTADIEAMRHVPYREAVGGLLYLVVATRPDLAYAVSEVSRYMCNPGEKHWNAVKRILAYLKGTLDLGISFNASTIVIKEDGHNRLTLVTPLEVYSDADFAGNVDTRRSTSGFHYFAFGGPIAWRSKLQAIVTLSTMESEYIAMCLAAQENAGIRQLLRDIGFILARPTILHEDNQPAIDLSKANMHSSRAKHIDIKYHYVREQSLCGNIVITACDTKAMVADIHTKGSFSIETFVFLRVMAGLLDLRQAMRGRQPTSSDVDPDDTDEPVNGGGAGGGSGKRRR
jgi:hypothetical protein